MPPASSMPSGLSLFVHLGIILIAWILSACGISRLYKKEVLPAGEVSPVLFSRIVATRVTALLILSMMAALMSLFLIVALQTGYREGMNEPHRVFMSQAVVELQNALVEVPDIFKYRAQYSRPTPELYTSKTLAFHVSYE